MNVIKVSLGTIAPHFLSVGVFTFALEMPLEFMDLTWASEHANKIKIAMEKKS